MVASSFLHLSGKGLNFIKGQDDLVGIKMNLLESQRWTVQGESRFRHSGISLLFRRERDAAASAKSRQGPGWRHGQGQLVLLAQNSVLLLGSLLPQELGHSGSDQQGALTKTPSCSLSPPPHSLLPGVGSAGPVSTDIPYGDHSSYIIPSGSPLSSATALN